MGTAFTWHWRKILRSPDRSSRSLAGSSGYRCWAGCIPDTSGAPPEQPTTASTRASAHSAQPLFAMTNS
jgi:hypothetical protein